MKRRLRMCVRAARQRKRKYVLVWIREPVRLVHARLVELNKLDDWRGLYGDNMTILGVEV